MERDTPTLAAEILTKMRSRLPTSRLFDWPCLTMDDKPPVMILTQKQLSLNREVSKNQITIND